MIEKIIGIEKAYKKKIAMMNTEQKSRNKRIKEERRKNGMCVYCGFRKADTEKGFFSCYKCRLENRKRKK